MEQSSKMTQRDLQSLPAGTGRRSEVPGKLLELILESIGEGVHGIDRNGRITFVNSAAARMLGWNVEELIGKPQHVLIHHSRRDGSPFPEDKCEILAAMRDGRVHHRDEEGFWRKDGTRFPVDYIATPLREQGIVIGAVVSFRYQFIRALRVREDPGSKRIPAIALTSYTATEDRIGMLAAGFQLHVPKPIDPIELVTVIATLAGRSIETS